MTEQKFQINCKGRDSEGREVLEKTIHAEVLISQRPGSNLISSLVECQYNTGSHGQRCNASHSLEVDKAGEGVNCPYSFDIPYALERNKKN